MSTINMPQENPSSQPKRKLRIETLVPQVNQSLSVNELLSKMDSANQILTDVSTSDHDVFDCMDDMIESLSLMKLQSSDFDWQEALSEFRNHPVLKTCHEDPFTRRAFEKPRGYAGDAELLDFIYGVEEFWELPEMSEVGKRIFRYTSMAPAPMGVRARRSFVADQIDVTCAKNPNAKVLSIAAGHLREAHISSAVRRRRFERFVALDADEQSLAEIKECYGEFGVETFAADVRQLMRGTFDLGKFDLIYSTGLFDYLNEKSAARLVSRTFEMLEPGGELIVANFLPNIHDIGYMDVFMDWRLVYRTRREMMEMTMDIPLDQIENIQIFVEENQNIIFLSIKRR